MTLKVIGAGLETHRTNSLNGSGRRPWARALAPTRKFTSVNATADFRTAFGLDATP